MSVVQCKAVVIGDKAVGKTSILNCLLGYPIPFSKKYSMTKGVSISSRSLKVSKHRNENIEIHFYDFSGRVSLYGSLMKSLWKNDISMVIGVLDVTREDSFQNLLNLISDFTRQANSRKESITGIILGNKCDLLEHRIVSLEDVTQSAKKLRMGYFDCSAKENVGVEEAFNHLARTWFETKTN